MTSLSGNFQTDLSLDDALIACTEAINGLGWHIETVEADRIVSYADALKVEVELNPTAGYTDIRITGSDTESNPLGEGAVIAALDRARDAIKDSIEGTESQAPAPAPGWYSDPLGSDMQRYWDGTQWTNRIQPDPDARAKQAVRDEAKPPGFVDRVREAPLWIKIVVPAVILLLIIGAISGGGSDSTTTTISPQAAKQKAQRAAASSRRAAIRERRQALAQRRQRIALQQARAQARQARAEARAARQAARRRAKQAQQASAPPAAAPPSTSSCDPSYSGACLDPNSSDYDCAGGSGDGPDYTGPVTVVGDDHYDLDSDGDGSACE